jgi:hypothetical protein
MMIVAAVVRKSLFFTIAGTILACAIGCGGGNGGSTGAGGQGSGGHGAASGGQTGTGRASGGQSGGGGQAGGGGVTAAGGQTGGGGSTATGGRSGTGGTGGGSSAAGGTGVGTGGADAGGANSDAGLCDPFANLGCSTGQKCTALQVGSTLVLGCGSKGTKKAGDACTQELADGGGRTTGDNCADGLACFTLQGESGAACRQFCSDDHPCPSTFGCTLTAPGNAGRYCSPVATCMPLEQTGCKSSEACYADGNGAQCATAGTKKAGEACVAANECERGTSCASVGGAASRCSQFCSKAVGGTPVCPAGKTCFALSGATLEPNTGVCN